MRVRVLLLALLALAVCSSASAGAAPPPPVTSLPLLLTFDDGPDPVWTGRVLDILAWKHVHGVFCMTGEHAAMHPDLVRRVVAEGHQLCDHSVDHPHVLTLDSAHQIGQVQHGYDMIVAASGGVAPRWWRAPYGQSRTALDGYAHSIGLTAIGWHAQGSDWSAGITPAQVEALWESPSDGLAAVPLVDHAVVPNTPPGVAVVLLHDGQGELHTTGSADRWPGTTVLVSLIDRYQVADPATL